MLMDNSISKQSPKPRIKTLPPMILCNWCAWPIKQNNLTKEELAGKTDLLFCSEECKQKYQQANLPDLKN